MRTLTTQIGVKVTDELASLLREVSRARGEDVSDFVRRSILRELASMSYLSDTQKKALGISPEEAPVE
jgi:uncharacterized protein (DUF1778 family)